MISQPGAVCKGLGVDKYDRILARCSLGRRDINGAMVEKGWAVSFGDYQGEERRARQSRETACGQVNFIRPQEWRDLNARRPRKTLRTGMFDTLLQRNFACGGNRFLTTEGGTDMKLYDGGRRPTRDGFRYSSRKRVLKSSGYNSTSMGWTRREKHFPRINPMQKLPVLELDDGTIIAETVAICRYFRGNRSRTSAHGHNAG